MTFSLKLLLAVSLCSLAGRCSAQPQLAKTSERFSQIEIVKKFGLSSAVEALPIGFTADDRTVIVVSRDQSYSKGQALWFNPRSGKTDKSLPTSSALGPGTFTVSPDGKFLAAYENIGDLDFSSPTAHNIQVFDAVTGKLIKRLDIGKNNHIHGLSFLSTNPSQILARVTSLIPYQGGQTRGQDRLEWWDWRTGKKNKSLPYNRARNVEEVLPSPDKKFIACLFFSDDDFNGLLEILDANTGKLVWKIEGNPRRIIDPADFFIAPDKLICNHTIYNLSTRQIAELPAVGNSKLQSVGNVGLSMGFSLCFSPRGLELWNIPKNKLLRRWPTLKTVDYVEVSPKLTVMAVHHGSTIEFWKFDPKWLR